MTFFERFSELATAKDGSPNATAKKLKISSGSVTAWSNGRIPRGLTISQLSEYFEVTTDYLLGKADTPTPLGIKKTPPDELTAEDVMAAAESRMGGPLNAEERAELLLRFNDLAASLKRIEDARKNPARGNLHLLR